MILLFPIKDTSVIDSLWKKQIEVVSWLLIFMFRCSVLVGFFWMAAMFMEGDYMMGRQL
jgi:hypothetical protein